MEICGDERAVGVEPSAPPLKNSEPPPDKGYLKKFKFFNFVFFPLQSCHRRSLFSQGRTETILFFFWGGFLSLRSWHKLLPFLASPLPNFSRSNVLSFQRSPVPTFSRFKSPPPHPLKRRPRRLRIPLQTFQFTDHVNGQFSHNTKFYQSKNQNLSPHLERIS